MEPLDRLVAGEARRGRARHRRRLPRVPPARRLSCAAAFRQRRPLGVLRRRAQGPAVHERAGFGSPAQRAVRVARASARSRCCARADPLVHRRRGLAIVARQRCAASCESVFDLIVSGIDMSTNQRSSFGTNCVRYVRAWQRTKVCATISSWRMSQHLVNAMPAMQRSATIYAKH